MESEILYRRLREHLDRMPIGLPATASGVELKILRQLFTPEEAEIALSLSAIPEPAAKIHQRLGSRMPLDELRQKLDLMDVRGLLLRIGPEDSPRYSKLMFVIGMYERQLPRLTPELERAARRYSEEGFAEAFLSKKTTQMRVVPVNRPVKAERSVANYDDIRAYVESFEGPFAKMDCICRQGRHLLGEKCLQTDLRQNCLTMGMAAEWVQKRMGATPITRAGMLEMLDEADRQGLVLQTENTQRPLFVCCCCHCCCGVLTAAQRFPRPAEYFSANFQAKVDADTCEACGMCATRCQMDAISENGKSEVIEERCIGCGLCVSTCPSGAMRLEWKDAGRVPPEETQALYGRILAERYGKWDLLKFGARKMLGMKI
jgi:electron transport complex protein RnfB